MPTIHVTAGLPGSGKSTYARQLVQASKGRVRRVNLDDLRMMLDRNDGSVRMGKDHEEVVAKIQDAAILTAVDAGQDVVIDNTHLSNRLPKRYKDLLAGRKAVFEVADFTDVPVEECIRRDAARERTVGEAVIRRMAKQLQSARKGGTWPSAAFLNDRPIVMPYVPDPSLPKAVLFDIDGTLALHRRGPYDFGKLETDLVNRPVHDALFLYAGAGYRIVLLSGRQMEYEAHTVRWLEAHGIEYDELWMRAIDDRRPDDTVKAELFDAHVRNRYRVDTVYDDRDRVVALWRRMGLTCMQVAPGAF